MAKHKSTAIKGDDLLNRIAGDDHEHWADVIGDNWQEDGELSEIAAMERVESLWWVVSWPQHVTTPRFNSDANYSECASESEARELADEVYGDF